MPHQCTRCGKVFPDAAEEILKGCSCGSRFFYYIRQEKLEQLKKEAREAMQELEKADKVQIEKDIRELTGMEEKPDEPVILDLESVRVIRPGKFEIDIVNLFNKRRPLIYKLEEGKYIIDLASSLKVDKELVAQKIRDPARFLEEEKQAFKKTLTKKEEEDGSDEEEKAEGKSDEEDKETEEEDEKEVVEEEEEVKKPVKTEKIEDKKVEDKKVEEVKKEPEVKEEINMESSEKTIGELE
jgi:predicted  nucleic acid-binding Zn-ribbon protein